jgi:hypothetical protein
VSKVVKGVGRAIGKVVKGVGNVVKKVAKSKLGKILVGAALVYFGGAALMGGIGGAGAAATGSGISGFFTGAGAGLSSAAQGISGAWTALTGGGGSVMGSLSGGLTGASSAGATAVSGLGGSVVGGGITPGIVSQTGSIATPAAGSTVGTVGGSSLVPAAPVNYSLASGAPGGLSTVGANIAPTVGAGAANPGLISGALNALGPYGKAAAVSGALQLGGAMYAKKEQEDATEEQRANYNRNIGGFTYA